MKIRINFFKLALLAPFFITGCNINVEISQDQLCAQVSNAEIETGLVDYRAVYLHEVSNGFVIGYDNGGKHVPHSDCTAATMLNNGDTSTYSWFLFGEEVEVNTIKSIMFYLNANGENATLASRFASASTWQEQNVENNIVTRQLWSAEPDITSIDVRNNYNGDKLKMLIAKINDVTKTVTYDLNSNAYNCIWTKDAAVVTDTGCTNSAFIDKTQMGLILDHAYYFSQLEAATIDYGTSEQTLDDQISRYFR